MTYRAPAPTDPAPLAEQTEALIHGLPDAIGRASSRARV